MEEVNVRMIVSQLSNCGAPSRDYSDTVIPTKLVSIGCESTCICSHVLADLEQWRSNEIVVRMRRRYRVRRMFQDQVGGLDRGGL
jgi:hypothetical protein